MRGFITRMREEREAGSIIQAAEQAAEGGNYVSAESLLREAARLQEESLGPRHPDLANTLNNLGIVCEMTGKSDDAEQYFRRAVSIARTSLHPDHPFVATSQKNLREFCESRGKQVELPPPTPAPVAEVRKPAPEVIEPAQEVTPAIAIEPEPEKAQLPAETLFRRVAVGVLGPIAMLMVILAIGLPRLGSPKLATPVQPIAIDSPRDAAPPTVAPPAPAEPDPVEPIAAPEETPTPDEATTTPGRPVVIKASLCGDIDDWSCDPADNPVPPGPLFFYTQIKSTSGTAIQHRWYHDGRLLQTVKLQVQANRKAGYRTYSRNVMTSASAGNWRVEVRSEDGALLHEERFTVR